MADITEAMFRMAWVRGWNCRIHNQPYTNCIGPEEEKGWIDCHTQFHCVGVEIPTLLNPMSTYRKIYGTKHRAHLDEAIQNMSRLIKQHWPDDAWESDGEIWYALDGAVSVERRDPGLYRWRCRPSERSGYEWHSESAMNVAVAVYNQWKGRNMRVMVISERARRAIVRMGGMVAHGGRWSSTRGRMPKFRGWNVSLPLDVSFQEHDEHEDRVYLGRARGGAAFIRRHYCNTQRTVVISHSRDA